MSKDDGGMVLKKIFVDVAKEVNPLSTLPEVIDEKTAMNLLGSGANMMGLLADEARFKWDDDAWRALVTANGEVSKEMFYPGLRIKD